MSKFVKLNHTNKYDTIREPNQHNVPEFDTIIFDGAAVVQIIYPNTLQTSQQYRRYELHNFFMDEINKVKRANVEFDIYKNYTIKLTAKE